MRKVSWIRIGAVAVLWSIVGGAAYTGWMVGRHDAAQAFAELQRRLAAGEQAANTCRGEVELLDLRRDRGAPRAPARRGDDAGPVEIAAPRYFHLRSLIMAR